MVANVLTWESDRGNMRIAVSQCCCPVCTQSFEFDTCLVTTQALVTFHRTTMQGTAQTHYQRRCYYCTVINIQWTVQLKLTRGLADGT